MSQTSWETAMGMRSYAGSSAEAEDREDARYVAQLVRGNGASGMVTADATRLLSRKATAELELAKKMGLLVSIPTGRRERGRRWFHVDFAPQE